MKYVLVLLLLLGCSSTDPEPVASEPVATFSASATEGAPPLTVAFDGSGSSNTAGFVWNFGDDSLARGAQVTHTFGEVGSYEVRLWVTGENGALSAPATRVITVREDEPTPPPTPEPPVNLRYEGTWAWVAEFELTGVIYVGFANFTEATNSPNVLNAEAGNWLFCASSVEFCPPSPSGASLIGDFTTSGEPTLGVQFTDNEGRVKLLALDADNELGNELDDVTVFGLGVWFFDDGFDSNITFGMGKAGDTDAQGVDIQAIIEVTNTPEGRVKAILQALE